MTWRDTIGLFSREFAGQLPILVACSAHENTRAEIGRFDVDDNGRGRVGRSGGGAGFLDGAAQWFGRRSDARLSDDGRVAGGWNAAPSNPDYPNGVNSFTWTQAGGRSDLSGLPGVKPYSFVRGISNDGRTVVGSGRDTFEGYSHAFRYRDGVYERLPSLQNNLMSDAFDASRDGSVVVGSNSIRPRDGFGAIATLWESDGRLVTIGYSRPGEHFQSEALAVSADGRVVAGYSAGFSSTDAFLWTRDGGFRILTDPDGGDDPIVEGLSQDGTIAVGDSGVAAMM